jgi:hypothetical protein
MSSLLHGVLGLHGWLAYLVVGAFCFGEVSFFVGFVLPGETAVVIGGVLASLQHVRLLQIDDASTERRPCSVTGAAERGAGRELRISARTRPGRTRCRVEACGARFSVTESPKRRKTSFSWPTILRDMSHRATSMPYGSKRDG